MTHVEDGVASEPGKQYDAFISYSHAADGQFAPLLQHALQRFAKSWRQRRALEVFRDKTGLAISPDLWAEISRSLDRSSWFIYLASPAAAASEWVGREIARWKATKDPERILVVLTDGDWTWDSAVGGFDPLSSTAIHPKLRHVFPSEPLVLDMRWAHAAERLTLRDARFRDAVAEIAAPIHGRAKDDLEDEDTRAQRRYAYRSCRSGAAGLSARPCTCGRLGCPAATRLRAQSAAGLRGEAAGRDLRGQPHHSAGYRQPSRGRSVCNEPGPADPARALRGGDGQPSASAIPGRGGHGDSTGVVGGRAHGRSRTRLREGADLATRWHRGAETGDASRQSGLGSRGRSHRWRRGCDRRSTGRADRRAVLLRGTGRTEGNGRGGLALGCDHGDLRTGRCVARPPGRREWRSSGACGRRRQWPGRPAHYVLGREHRHAVQCGWSVEAARARTCSRGDPGAQSGLRGPRLRRGHVGRRRHSHLHQQCGACPVVASEQRRRPGRLRPSRPDRGVRRALTQRNGAQCGRKHARGRGRWHDLCFPDALADH